jgi:hypothetical protein
MNLSSSPPNGNQATPDASTPEAPVSNKARPPSLLYLWILRYCWPMPYILLALLSASMPSSLPMTGYILLLLSPSIRWVQAALRQKTKATPHPTPRMAPKYAKSLPFAFAEPLSHSVGVHDVRLVRVLSLASNGWLPSQSAAVHLRGTFT